MFQIPSRNLKEEIDEILELEKYSSLEIVQNKCLLLETEIEDLKQKNKKILERNLKYECLVKQANIDIMIFKEKVQENCDTQVELIRKNHDNSLKIVKDDLFKQLSLKDAEISRLNNVSFYF